MSFSLTVINYGCNGVATTKSRSHLHLQQTLALHKGHIDTARAIELVLAAAADRFDDIVKIDQGPYRGLLVSAELWVQVLVPWLATLAETGPVIVFVTINLSSPLVFASAGHLAALRDSVWSSFVSYFTSVLRLQHGRLSHAVVTKPLAILWNHITKTAMAMPHRRLDKVPPLVDEMKPNGVPKSYVGYVLARVLTSSTKCPFDHVPLSYMLVFTLHAAHILTSMYEHERGVAVPFFIDVHISKKLLAQLGLPLHIAWL